jgi:hypothetical protein
MRPQGEKLKRETEKKTFALGVADLKNLLTFAARFERKGVIGNAANTGLREREKKVLPGCLKNSKLFLPLHPASKRTVPVTGTGSLESASYADRARKKGEKKD